MLPRFGERALLLREDRQVALDDARQDRIVQLLEQGDGAAIVLTSFVQAPLLQAQTSDVLAQPRFEPQIPGGERLGERALVQRKRFLQPALAMAKQPEARVSTGADMHVRLSPAQQERLVVTPTSLFEVTALLLHFARVDQELRVQPGQCGP